MRRLDDDIRIHIFGCYNRQVSLCPATFEMSRRVEQILINSKCSTVSVNHLVCSYFPAGGLIEFPESCFHYFQSHPVKINTYTDNDIILYTSILLQLKSRRVYIVHGTRSHRVCTCIIHLYIRSYNFQNGNSYFSDI